MPKDSIRKLGLLKPNLLPKQITLSGTLWQNVQYPQPPIQDAGWPYNVSLYKKIILFAREKFGLYCPDR